ncbi:MAG: hypothetical protein IPL67_10690 [Ignavibacteria bacterium]|nr:hypothetical protein [Ignavibacteria bacterium]
MKKIIQCREILTTINHALCEDFEAGTFPPAGWSVTSGTTMWQQANTSAFGIGNYSASYDNYSCYYISNTIYSSSFPATVAGNKPFLMFLYAWRDSLNLYFDNLDIYYYDSVSSSYIFSHKFPVIL